MTTPSLHPPVMKKIAQMNQKWTQQTSKSSVKPPKRPPTPSASDSIPLQNKYASLDEGNIQEEKMEQSNEKTPPPTSSKPPQIYVYGVQNTYTFTKTLSSVCQTQPKIQHTREFIRFQFNNRAYYDKVLAFCHQHKPKLVCHGNTQK